MANGRNLREVGSRIETLLEELRSVADEPVRDTAEELVRALAEFYGAGLERIVELVGEEPGGEAVLGRLADDDLVASLLVLQDLHPVDVLTRVERALDRVRPYLGSHAGGVEFLGVDEAGVAHLRLEGSCHGCPSSAVTVKLAIERAIEEAAPELAGIAVEGVVERSAERVISLDSLRRNGTATQNGAEAQNGGNGTWISVAGLEALRPGEVLATDVDGAAVVVCRVDETLFAYRNRCPACAATWTTGGNTLERQILSCPVCAERYDVQLAGRGLDGRTSHLHPLPLLVEGGEVRIALPGAVA